MSYVGGTVSITLGFEADVSPRPNGSNSGTVTVADWAQIGRFSAGLDQPTLGSEFQRADCAPLNTLGNGVISVADWSQAGRFAAGLDAVPPAGGPTSEPAAPVMMGRVGEKSATARISAEAVSTVIRIGPPAVGGKVQLIPIEVEAQGTENGFGFSLEFDSSRLQFISAAAGDEMDMAVLHVNAENAAQGRVGFALALPAGKSLTVGRHRLMLLMFRDLSSDFGQASISFGDHPVAREVVDVNAKALKAIFERQDSAINYLNPYLPDLLPGTQFTNFVRLAKSAKLPRD
jgi:hypothetical protein